MEMREYILTEGQSHQVPEGLTLLTEGTVRAHTAARLVLKEYARL